MLSNIYYIIHYILHYITHTTRETMISCIAGIFLSELLVYVRNVLATIFDFMTEED